MLQRLVLFTHVFLLRQQLETYSYQFLAQQGGYDSQYMNVIVKIDCMALATSCTSQNTVPLKVLKTVPSNQFSVKYAQPVGTTLTA